jgi:hypothetical protein
LRRDDRRTGETKHSQRDRLGLHALSSLFCYIFYSCVSHGLTDFDLYVKCAGRQGRGGEILPVRDP